MDSQEIYILLHNQHLEAIQEMIIQAPPTQSKDFSLQLLKFGGPLAILNALSPLCMEYTFGKNCEFGVELSRATLKYAMETYNSQDGNMPLMLMTVSRFALNLVNGLNTLGRFQETLQFLDAHLEYFLERDAKENMSSIMLGKVYALLNTNEIDEAEDVLFSLDTATIEFDASIEYDRLKKLIIKNKEKPHTIDQELGERTGKNLSPFSDLIREFGGNNESEFLDRGTDFLTGGGEEMNQWQADSITRKATTIFLGQPSRNQINESLKELLSVRNWTHQHGGVSSDNDALWGLYLCYSRLKNASKAADMLLEMQKNHERLRSNIKNPVERAGVYSAYPYFFGALCKMLLTADRVPELLNAMESSKGRAIADILTQNTEDIISDYQIAGPVHNIIDYCKKHDFHYLSYFVDDEEVFAVLVSKAGKLYSSGAIPISKKMLRRAILTANPQQWGKVIFQGMKKTIIPSTAKILSPLVQWLEPLLEDHILEKGDHICYSPDENIFNIPLHYLDFKDDEILDYFSVSRIHGVFSLMHALQVESHGYERFLSFLVPTQQDKQKETMDGVFKGLLRTNDFLHKILPGKTRAETEAHKAAFLGTNYESLLIHFGTHGIFPLGTRHRDQNPFRGSGLLLSGEDELPDKKKIEEGEDMELVLTPEDLFNSKIRLSNCHITMQACVSGLSREGVGGDAIGLEWTLLLAGASSVLSTHWNIGAMPSYHFLKSFYSHYIEKDESLAGAWRYAVLEMKQSADPELNDPGVYAAYSITGNWN